MKIRSGFVSNSSSSSFILIPDKKGRVKENGYTIFSATMGVGLTASVEMTDDESDDGELATKQDVFTVVSDYDGDEGFAFVRPLSQMAGSQTLADFFAETKSLFDTHFGNRAKKVKGPQVMLAGEGRSE